MRQLGVLLIAAAALLAACGGGDGSDQAAAREPEAPVEAAQAQEEQVIAQADAGPAQAETVAAQASAAQAVEAETVEAEVDEETPAAAEQAEAQADEAEAPVEIDAANAELIAYIDGLSVGACYNDAFDAEGELDYSAPALVVDCSQPHDNEIYHYASIGNALGASPTDEAIEALAIQTCAEGFATFVGATPDESDLGFYIGFFPNAAIFAAGESRLVCGVFRDSFEPMFASAANRAIGFPDRTFLAYEGLRDGFLNLHFYREIPAGFYEDSLTSALPFSNMAQPVWSYDGTMLAFMVEEVFDDGTSQRDIYLLRGINTDVMRLTDGPGNNDSPAFSPDGGRIAFASDRSGDLELYVMNTDGSNVVQLTDSPGSDTSPAWSPDGSQIAFRSNRDGDPDVYVMNADGSNVRQLTNSPEFDGSPSWSPDGSMIAFDTKRDGNFEIYVMKADGSDAVNLSQNPDADDEFPDWGGSTIYEGSAIAVTVNNEDIVVLVLAGPQLEVFVTFAVTDGGADNPSRKAAWRLR